MTNSLEKELLARIAGIVTIEQLSLKILWSKMIIKPKLVKLQLTMIHHVERQHSREWTKKTNLDVRSFFQRDPTSNSMNKKSSSAHSKNR